MKKKLSRSGLLVPAFAAIAVLAAVSCGASPAEAPCPKAAAPPSPTPPPAPVTAETPPTPEQAAAFMAGVEKEIRRLWVARDEAGWVNQTYITDDTEALSAQGEEATAAFVADAVHKAQRFQPIVAQLPADLARKFLLLRFAQTVPAPDNDAERTELASIESWMTSAYGKGQYCPKPGSRLAAHVKPGECMHLGELENVLSKSRSPEELKEAWAAWHAVGAPMKDKFARYVELGNKGAKEEGFDDLGALWRGGYDMPPADFEADIERLCSEVKPLYEQLHCFVRSRLQAKYGKAVVPDHGPIPADLLGNMWAQEWNNISDLTVPYRQEASLDVTRKLEAGRYDAKKMVKLGERFFTSLGFDPLPKTFWERSQLTRPPGRDVVCHASAWDVTWSNDLRVKMCIEPTEEDLVTIHHELGHDFYFQRYTTLPILFQQGANDGFHEGIGDTLALSVTPAYLKGIGLLDTVPKNEKARINQQMKMALSKVAFLPFGLLIDKWRWDVLSGKTPKDHYNAAWWALREKYQGVSAPVPRSEADFDPGAKFHVPSSTPYIRYFLARIYQFQFHRALCKAAGYTGSLDTCSIYGNPAAGEKLRAMLALGASKPWPDALETVGAGRKADAGALLEYFAPLRAWLEEQNKGQTCGW